MRRIMNVDLNMPLRAFDDDDNDCQSLPLEVFSFFTPEKSVPLSKTCNLLDYPSSLVQIPSRLANSINNLSRKNSVY